MSLKGGSTDRPAFPNLYSVRDVNLIKAVRFPVTVYHFMKNIHVSPGRRLSQAFVAMTLKKTVRRPSIAGGKGKRAATKNRSIENMSANRTEMAKGLFALPACGQR